MEALIFIGLQGSGKTTFYSHYFLHSHLRISLDLLRTRHREATFLQTCLQTQQRFVVDNTNPTRTERTRYIEPAKAARFTIIGYYVATPLEQALAQNEQRHGAARIPERGIRATYHKLELPHFNEGFDQLYCVTTDLKGRFTIKEWHREV